MALPAWNTSFTARDVAGATHKEVLTRLWFALWERIAAVNANSPPAGPVVPTTGHEPKLAYHGGASDTWEALQASIIDIAKYFMRRFNGDGSDYTPQGFWGLDSPLYHKNNDGTNTKIAFPHPNGWERRFPRTIYRISQPGVDGQRAWFSARTGIAQFTEIEWADALFGTNPVTPVGEYENSGKLFDNVAGNWILSLDQTSSPDEVIEYAGVNWERPWKLGDYFGWWNINDARDAINQLAKLPAQVSTILGGSISDDISAVMEGQLISIWYYEPDEITDKFGSGGDRAGAEADYDAHGGANAIFLWPQMLSNGGGGSAGDGAGGLRASKYRLQITNRFGGFAFTPWPNPRGNSAEASYWGWINKSGYDYISFPSAVYEWDDYGEAVSEDAWQEFSMQLISDDFSIKSDFLGVLPAVHFTPPWPTADGASRGWQARRGMVLLNYEIVGGFDYSLATI